MKRNSGFTLIELLVVIAIIAVLAAILFPVFTKAKQKAWQSTCNSHATQLGKAFRMYGDDWNGRYPTCGEMGDAPGKCPLYFALRKYISGGPQLFMCPADTGEQCIGGDATPFWKAGFCSSWAWPRGYRWVDGALMENPGASKGDLGKTWQLREPMSKRPVIFDHRPWHWSSRGTGWTSIPGKTTVLWADGHVSMSDHNTMLAFMNIPDNVPAPPGF